MSEASATPKGEPEPNLADLSEEELNELLLQDTGFAPRPPEPEPEEVSEPEADVQSEPEEAATTEPTAEEPAEAAEPEEPGDAPEQAPDDGDLDAEILKARLEEVQAEAKKWESVAGRHAGKMGYLEGRLKALETRMTGQPPTQPEPTSEYDLPDEAPEVQPRPTVPPTQTPEYMESVASYAVGQAIKSAGTDFFQQRPDAAELMEGIQAYLEKQGYNAAPLLEAKDPVYAAKETVRALEEAYYHVNAERKAAVRKELEERRAAQISNIDEAKRKAAVSASGASPPPKPKPKTYADMSVEELEAEIEKEYGDHR